MSSKFHGVWSREQAAGSGDDTSEIGSIIRQATFMTHTKESGLCVEDAGWP